jgi:hypothetical protein
MTPKFPLGRVVATPAALEALTNANASPLPLLARHQCGDWGEVCDEDKRANDLALAGGGRLLSAYPLPGTSAGGVRLWVITEAADDQGRRAVTTLLLPSDY